MTHKGDAPTAGPTSEKIGLQFGTGGQFCGTVPNGGGVK